MTSETIATSTVPWPPDPTLTNLRAKVHDAVAETARKLGSAPATVWAGQDSTGRHAAAYFDDINSAGAWADWLHWPYATANRDGKIVFTAYGQWLGFSWQFVASEPLEPVHREG